MTSNNANSNLQFLSGGGEMGQLIREKDWSKSPLGVPENWPQSLRTTLSIILNSKFPMFLFWGPELICFYNDAYRPSLGETGKHPDILGGQAQEYFQEIWKDIKPIIDNVMDKGEANWNEDMYLPSYRNGILDDLYWTFSYSPVHDESGKPAGVFVTCFESTEKVKVLKQLNQSNEKYLNNILHAPVAMCVFRGENLIVEIANDLMLELWEKKIHDVLNKPYFEAVPETKEQGLEVMLANVYKTGETFSANESPVNMMRNGKIETVYLNFVCEALKESDGTISGVIGTAIEVTNQVISRKSQEETEQKIRALVENAPFAIAVYTGEEMRVELANQAIIDIWGKGNDVIGRTFTDILPELAGQSVFEQIKDVYTTGKAFHTKNTPLDLIVNGKKGTFYFNYDFTPLYDLSGTIYGVMNTGVDVTEINLAKQKIEEGDERFRNTVKQAPVGIIILRTKDYIVEMANAVYMELVDRDESTFIGFPLFDSLPESKESTLSLMHHVMDTGESYRGNEVPVPLVRNGRMESCYFDFVYHPLAEDDGTISGIIVTVSDVTEKVESRKKIEESEERFRNTVKQAPVAIAIFRSRDYVAEMANNAYLELVDRTESEFVGKPLFESLPEVESTVKHLLDGVYDTGIPFHGYEIAAPIKRKGEIGIFNFDLLYSPLKEEDGTISGIVVTATEVTEKVQSRKKIERNEERLNIVIEASELGTWELNLRTKEANYSPKYLEIVSGLKEYKQLTHEQLVHYLHPDDMEIRNRSFAEALETGILNYQARLIWDDQSIHWMEGKGRVFYDEENVPVKMIGTIRDITKEKSHQLELEVREKRFRRLTDSVPVLIWMAGTDKLCYFFNKGWLNFTGKTMEEESGNGWTNGVHPDDFDRCLKFYSAAFDKREEFYMEYRLKRYDGEYRWISDKGVPRFNSKGEFEGYIGACMDIHNEKSSLQLLMANEQKFRLLADSMPQHIWTADTDGNLNYYNQSVMDYSGMSLMEIEEKGWLDIVHPDDRERNMEEWQKSILSGEDFILEHRFRRYDGTYRWQLSRAIAQRNENGEIDMWVGTSTDIQDQKMFVNELEKQVSERTKELEQSNESLKQSEQRYHLMVEEVQDYAILYLSKEGIVENWNKGAEKIKGYKADEIVGRSFSTFYTDEDKESNLPQYLLKQAEKYGRYGQEGWRKRKDGTHFWASVVITAVHDETGEVIGFSKVTHDLTFKKEADDKIKLNSEMLEQKNQQLEKMNKELQSFAYISSHDLQEPLRKIQTFSDQIAEREAHNLTENGKDKFKRMQNAAKRMQTLINDLLAYSRSNTQEKKLIKTDLSEIIENIKEDLSEELQQKNAIIEYDKAKCEVQIIPFQFHQLLFNLVSNSLKFSKEDVVPLIKIKYEIQKGKELDPDKFSPDTDYCHITYSDNGIGFDQQYAEKIFEVFQRLHGKETYQGTGIGLAIVKKIMENHNGSITATGIVGKGATFNIVFPAKSTA